jgi:hypothetical protein
MAVYGRTDLHQEVVEALLESKVIDFEAAGSVLARFGEHAARSGAEFGVLIGRRVIDVCIPPYYNVAAFEAIAEAQG